MKSFNGSFGLWQGVDVFVVRLRCVLVLRAGSVFLTEDESDKNREKE